jgi:hypothetical protein
MPSVRAVAVSSVLAVCGSLLFISPLAAHAPTTLQSKLVFKP